MTVGDLREELLEAFPDAAFEGAGRLLPEMKTGFVWTSQQDVIVLAANRDYFSRALNNPGVAVIVATPGAVHEKVHDQLLIVSEAAEACFYYLHNYLANSAARATPLPEPVVHPGAIIEKGACIGPGAVIDAGVRIGANAVVEGRVRIGENAVVEPGVVIGCEGLFAKRILSGLEQVRHFGGVTIGAHSYIHSGAVIVRSAMYDEATVIGDRAHIGIMSNVGHDAVIGVEAVLSSNTVIAGRVRIGAGAWIGASATISNGIEVGERARVNIGAVCIRHVAAETEVSGNFALEHARNIKRYLRDCRGK